MQNHKLAFLFLIIDDINNPEIWEKYLEDINRRNIYVHPKHPENVKSFLKNYIIDDLRETTWGFIINAYEALFTTAIKDDELNKYFIIISESDIPVKSFNTLYNFVKSNYIELWEITKFDENNRLNNLKVFPIKNIIKHSAFYILDRSTVHNLLISPYLQNFKEFQLAEEFFLSIVYKPKIFENVMITFADWEWTAKKYQEYKSKFNEYWKLYKLQGNANFKKIAEEYDKKKNDVAAHPKLYTNLSNNIIERSLEKGTFFCRKFTPLSNSDTKQIIKLTH